MLLKNNKFIGAAGVLALVSNLSVTVACSEKINEIKDGEELYTDKYDEEDIYFQNMQDTKYDDYYNKDFEEQEYTYLDKPENENIKGSKDLVNPSFYIDEYKSELPPKSLKIDEYTSELHVDPLKFDEYKLELAVESLKNPEVSSDKNNSNKDLNEHGYIYLDKPENENIKESEEKEKPLFDVGKYGSISSEEYFKKLKNLNEEKIKKNEEEKKNSDITKYASVSSEDYKKIKDLDNASKSGESKIDFSPFPETLCEVFVTLALCLTIMKYIASIF